VVAVRAPLRISFAGGGTDVPEYYNRFDGMVVSVAIDSYVNVELSRRESGHGSPLEMRGGSSGTEARSAEYADAARLAFDSGGTNQVEITRDLPSGMGLGSSSALSVALTAAFLSQNGVTPAPDRVAGEAASLEMDRLEMPIGKQDHYASAFGGLNAIHFRGEKVDVEPLPVTASVREWMENSLLLFSFGRRHDSREILAEQRHRTAADPDVLAALHRIRGHAADVRQAILDDQPERIGEIIAKSWLEKRRIASGVTTGEIDAVCAAALEAGAAGCKVTGAGGGGCLLVVCAPQRHASVRETLNRHDLSERRLGFDLQGAQVLAGVQPALTAHADE
jgi:D-glycero-alpha-D-manno-heptose-7-phosphate kinase